MNAARSLPTTTPLHAARAAIVNDNLDPEVAALIAEDAWPGEKDVLCP
jgi:hypothetical protein